MTEKRLVTLTLQREVEVDVDEEYYEYEPVWDGENFSTESHIDEDALMGIFREAINIPDGWEEVNMEIE